MLRKILLVAAVLLAIGSLARAGENVGLKVEAKLEIGVVSHVEAEVDGDLVEYGGVSINPVLLVSQQFNERWSAQFKLKGLFGFDDSDGEVLEEEGDVSFNGLEIGGLAGYTFKANEQLSITPVAGLSWRSVEVEGDMNGEDLDAEFEADYLVLDFGAQLAFKANDKLTVTGALMFGLPLTGESEVEVEGNGLSVDDEGDLDGGFLVSLAGGVEYKLRENILLTGGLAYEMGTIDWEYNDMDEEGEEELNMLTLQFGVVFKF